LDKDEKPSRVEDQACSVMTSTRMKRSGGIGIVTKNVEDNVSLASLISFHLEKINLLTGKGITVS